MFKWGEFEMKERPIIFKGDMVNAIMEGRKTETRRIIKPQPPEDVGKIFGPEEYEPAEYDKYGEMFPGKPVFGIYDEDGDYGIKCPYGQIGDRLWVRETFREIEMTDGRPYAYRASGDIIGCWHWKPSIFMPRKASRINLEITDIKVERVQDIIADGALADGGWKYNTCPFYKAPIKSFQHLWDSINKNWNDNPWVWVIKFKRME